MQESCAVALNNVQPILNFSVSVLRTKIRLCVIVRFSFGIKNKELVTMMQHK